jgi:hypothetical protein
MFEDIKSVILGILWEAWEILDESSLYILFGLFVAGLIQAFVKQERIAKYLGPQKIKSVFLAALFGIPLPLCSCGVLPTAISLRKQGASKGATVSFLISTPESGVDSIAITYALIDPLMTIFRPIAAFITAMTAGIVENLFPDRKTKERMEKDKNLCIFCEDEENTIQNHNHSLSYRLIKGLHYAFTDLLGDIAKWLLIGVGIAGIISYFVPKTLIENYLGYGWQAMLIMLIVGIPLYICATASTPIAAALIAKGMSPGVALVFLLVGPATNIAGVLSVGKFLGKRFVVIYLLSISVCAIVLGLLLNQIYLISGINIKATLGKAGEVLPHYIKVISSIILIILMVNSIRHETNEKKREKNKTY